MIVSFVLLLFFAAFFGQGSFDCRVTVWVNETHSWIPQLPDERVNSTNFVGWYLNDRIIYDSDVNSPLNNDDFSVWAPAPYTFLHIQSVQRCHSGIYKLFSDYTLDPWVCELDVYGVPTFNYIRVLHDEALRPSGSSGGLVERRDRILVEFSFTRHPDDVHWFGDNEIYQNVLESYGWTLSGINCKFNLSLCPEVPGTRDCYCKSVTTGNTTGNTTEFTYILIYNSTLHLHWHSEEIIRFLWRKNNKRLLEGVATDTITLPVICRDSSATFTTQGERRVADSELHTVVKIFGRQSLTFSVTNLITPYRIRIASDIRFATTTTGTSVRMYVLDSDIGRVFTLSYEENSRIGCGRSRSIDLVYLSGVPTFNNIRVLHDEALRPTGSSGGFVEGRDRIIIEFSFTRHPDAVQWFRDNAIRAQKHRLINWLSTWITLTAVNCDVSGCPEVPGSKDCYCKSVTTGNTTGKLTAFTYTLIYNATVNEHEIRFIWHKNNEPPEEGVATDTITLPIICRDSLATIITQWKRIVIDTDTFHYTVEKSPGNTSLTFSVTSLTPPFSMQIRREDRNEALAITTRRRSLTTFVSDSDVGKVFTLSYEESSRTGCGRHRSIELMYMWGAGGPTFNYIRFLHDEALRPSGSSGGLMEGRDRFVIEFSFTRHIDDVLWFQYNAILAQKLISTNGMSVWTPLPAVNCEVSGCPEVPGIKDCYCKSVTTGNTTGNTIESTYTLIYNATANFFDHGREMRFIWHKNNESPEKGVATDTITLPIICRQANATFTTQGETRVADIEHHTVVKISGITSLTFNVTNLIAPYRIQIGTEDRNEALAITTTGTSVRILVTDFDIRTVFTLTYEENSKIGCGRSRSIDLVYLSA